MSELFTWEYKGDYWIGYKRDDGSLGGISKQGWQGIVYSQVTNLHKVKVVDADAVVLAHEDKLNSRTLVKNFDGSISTFLHYLHYPFTPPVTEPKGFGAIVEAKLNDRHGIGGFPVAERKHLWKLESSGWELINIEGFSALWCWFIDPVVISEGVSNGLC